MAVHSPFLKPVTGKNRYCGPTALATFTGLSTDEIARIARLEFPHKRSVKGMHNSEVIRVVQRLGGRAHTEFVPGVRAGNSMTRRPTLKEWIAEQGDRLKGRRLIVECTGHYVAVSGEMVLCSVQGRQKRHYLSAAYANREVRRVIEIALPAKIAPPPAARKPKDVARTARERAKALANELQVNVEPTGWVRNEFELRPEYDADWRPLAEAAIADTPGAECWEGVMRWWSGDVSLLEGWDEVLRALTALKGSIDDALLKALDSTGDMP